MNVRPSHVDKDILCCIIESEAPHMILETLKDRGLGFAIWGEGVETPVVVIDNRDGLTEDQLLAIEAHELGHIMTESDVEVDAELYAIALLRLTGHHTAAQLLLDRGIVDECNAAEVQI